MLQSKYKNKIGSVSIRKKVIFYMVVIFVCMFAVLYLVFYNSMLKMLREREHEDMQNKVTISENILISSFAYIPSITKDWADFDAAYEFVRGNFDEFIPYYLEETPYKIFNLDFVTLLDVNGNAIYENFAKKTDAKQERAVPNLTQTYSKLGPRTTALFNSKTSGPKGLEPMGIDGFLKIDNTLLYISAYPILRGNGTGPCVGTLIFGRVISKTELSAMGSTPKTEFSVFSKDEIQLSKEQTQLLQENQTLVTFTSQGGLVAYKQTNDIFGESTLLLSSSGARGLYKSGLQLIAVVLLIIAFSCATMLLTVIKLIEHIVVKPLALLVQDVNNIDFDSASKSSIQIHNNKEFNFLAEAMGNMLSRIKTSRDIIRKKNEKLYYNANYDALTGLGNWIYIRRALNKMIAIAQRESNFVGVFFIDLDRFKFVNDTLGHTVGDHFIIAIAQRMKDELGTEPTIGRTGGDEFVVIVGGMYDKCQIHLYEDAIMAMFEKPFVVGEREMYISASVGSSSYPQDGRDMEALLKNAEIAMYRAKELGGHMNFRYESELDKVLQRKLYVENRIRSAIQDGCTEFRAYFQPKALSKTGDIFSCEALIRWVTPQGVIGPSEFIPMAEESGLIVPLSKWMLKESCRCNKIFEEQGIYNTVSVNISAQVLLHKDFINMIKDAVAETKADIKRLDIEITEATLINDIVKVNEVLNALHELGITISIDDFGTGYSSLSYLKKLSVDRIKIDRSFITTLNENEEDKTIVNAIVAMAKSLHMLVTAEGVETIEQLTYLKSIECEEIQGYYISKPITHQEYIAFHNLWTTHNDIS